MARVELTGWNEGLQKISLNHLLRARCGLQLAAAKDIVDRLLNLEQVSVEFESFTESDAEALTKIGVTYKVVDASE